MARIAVVLGVALLLMSCGGPPEPPLAPSNAINAQVTARSSLPADPSKLPYPDSQFSVEVRFGESATNTVHAKGTLWVQGVKDRQFTPAAEIAVGDWIAVQGREFSEAGKDRQRMQLFDELDPLAEYIFVVDTLHAGTAEPLKATVRKPAPAPTEIIPPNDEAPTPEEIAARAKRIEQARQAIEARLAENGGNWDTWFEKLAPVRHSLSNQLEGVEAVFQDELSLARTEPFTYRFRPDAPPERHMIEVLQTLNKGFAAYDTHLILVPIPERELVVAPHFLSPDELPKDGILQPERHHIHHALMNAGLEVWDLLPELRAACATNRPLFYHGSYDSHPGPGAHRVIADALATRLRSDYPSLPPPQTTFGTNTIVVTEPKPPYPNAPIRPVPRRHTAEQIITPDGNPLVLPEQAPLLFIGDSWLEGNWNAKGGNIPNTVAHRMGNAPSAFIRYSGTYGMGHTLERMPAPFFANRKVAVFLFDNSYLVDHPDWWRAGELYVPRRKQLDRLAEQSKLLMRINSVEDFQLGRVEPDAPDNHITPAYHFLAPQESEWRWHFPDTTLTAGTSYLVGLRMKLIQPVQFCTLRFGDKVVPLTSYKGQNRHLFQITPEKTTEGLRLEFPPFGTKVWLQEVELYEVKSP